MGKPDISMNSCLKNRVRFADICNAKLYQGKQIIKPEELELVDSKEGLILPLKDGKGKGLERTHDVIMRWKKQVLLMIITVEHQSKVHYAMPVRKMIIDGMVYARQIQELYENRGEKEYMEEEFLSRFRKEDRLVPVIPLLFSCDLKGWDASTDIHGMIDWSRYKENRLLKKLVPNYFIHLIDINDDSYIDKLNTDLQCIFGMVKYKKDKEKIREYMAQNAAKISRDIYYAIAGVFGITEKVKEAAKKNGGSKMSNALLELLEDEKNEGRKEGKKEGRQELLGLIQAMAANGEQEEILRLTTDMDFFQEKLVQYQIGEAR